MSNLLALLQRTVRNFDLLHGEGAAARETLVFAAIGAGAAILAIGIAAIGKGL
jgi:hypothetical protein